jgi:hypothetical protein
MATTKVFYMISAKAQYSQYKVVTAKNIMYKYVPSSFCQMWPFPCTS